MWKRYLLGFILLTTAGILSLPWWFSSKHMEGLANHFLAPEYQLQLADQWQFNATDLQLPTLTLKTPQCTLAELKNTKLSWWKFLRLNVEKAELDYACLTQLPSKNESSKSSLNLTALLAWLPTSDISIADFRLINDESLKNENLRQLLHNPISLNLAYNGKQLAANVSVTELKEAKSAVIFQHHSLIEPNQSGFKWQGKVDYQPESEKNYHLDFSTQLTPNLTDIPTEANVELAWQNKDFSVNQGTLNIRWSGEKGQIYAQDLQRDKSLLDIPFVWKDNLLLVDWGKVNWTFEGYQPMRGFVGLKIKKTEPHFFPLKIDFNMILQTFGEFGKGEIVFSTKEGEIGVRDNNYTLLFDVTTRGDLRYNHNVAQTNLNYHINGTFADPYLTFGQGSVFKMDNVQPDSKIHVRLPMDDIVIGRYGLIGRLQATLQGNTPQLEQLNLKLDGQANEFIAGIKTVFDLPDKPQNATLAGIRATNRWDWNIQGSTIFKSLNTQVKLDGVGFWQDDHIELNQLTAHSGNVNTGGVKMAPISLELKDRLRWNYEKEKIRGLAQAKTDWIEFGYGGRFERPILTVGIDGKNINHFSVAGDLHAGVLGPLDILASYENTELNGKISWKAQSAKVFQSLFPQDWDWAIHGGSIEGGTDFSVDENGIAIHGELRLKNGEISFPDGEIQGLDIDFPLNYQDYALQAKVSYPVKISAKNIKIGALDIQQAKLNAHGSYPYSAKKPFSISQVEMGIFDGKLTLPSLSFPQQKISAIELQQIDLAKVLDMAQYNQINMQGRINANLPFWLEHKVCLVCDGKISKADNISISLSKEMAQGLQSAGLTEKMLVELIKYMELTDLDAKVNLDPQGQMNLAVTVAGYNPDYKTHNPIRLNYHHKENMFELWRMIDYGSQFEQNLEYRLYQRSKK